MVQSTLLQSVLLSLCFSLFTINNVKTRSLEFSRQSRSLIHNEESYKNAHNGSHRRPSQNNPNENSEDHNQVDYYNPNPIPLKDDPSDPLTKVRLDYREKYRMQKPPEYEKIVKAELADDWVDEENNYGEEFDPKMMPSFSRKTGRGAAQGSDFKWPYEIWIQVDDKFRKKKKEIIKSAIWTITLALKCFHVLEIPASQPIPEGQDFLYIRYGGLEEGCYSSIGRRGKKQITTLSDSCRKLYGTAMHEILHVLGFLHEHTRPDRDFYVRVNESLLTDDISKLQYAVEPEQDLYVEEYDYESILHYSFSKIMRARKKNLVPPGITVGQRVKLSDLDYNRIRNFYPCDDNDINGPLN